MRVFIGSDGIDVWQNREVLPRAFVVYRAEVASDGAGAAARLALPSFRPDRVAVVEAPVDGVPEPRPDEPLPRADPVISLARDSSLDLALEVEARAPGVLVMSEVYYPGWEVTVDGKPDTVLRVDYALRGVRLSPGHHVIELAFFNRPLRRGAAVSAAALLVLLLLLGLHRRIERRRF